jgi:hypothetical protein
VSAPTRDQQSQLDWLYVQLEGLQSDLRHLSRAYTNGTRYGAHATVTESARSSYEETRGEYNRIVGEINALTAPFRAARRAEVKARFAAQRREELRRATCTECGLIHAGEC